MVSGFVADAGTMFLRKCVIAWETNAEASLLGACVDTDNKPSWTIGLVEYTTVKYLPSGILL